MSARRRATPREHGRLLMPALAIVMLFTLLGADSGPRPDRRTGRLANGRPDTTLVFGTEHYVRDGVGTYTSFGKSFSVAETLGWRHLLQIWNGDSAGHRVNNGYMYLNGRMVVTTSELHSGVGSLKRVVWPKKNNNTLNTWISGAAGSFIDVNMVAMQDPEFVVVVPESFPKLNPVQTVVRTISLPGYAPAPYAMHVLNGNADGTQRVTNAQVWLNGVLVLDGSSWGAGVARRDLDVAYPYQLAVRITNPPGSFLKIWFTATDTTAPALAIAWPPNDYVCDSTSVPVVGTSTDETPGKLEVGDNGPCCTSPGDFAETVTFGADGVYAIHVRADNSAGYATDSVRTVIHDLHAPTVTLTAPASETIETTASQYVVTGSWADSTATAVTLNGEPVGPAAKFGSISRTLDLSMGANPVAVTATDAAGRRTTLVRHVLREAVGEPAPPVLPGAPDDTLTQVSRFASRQGFLRAIQPGLDQSRLVDTLVAVLRGRVIHATTTPVVIGLPNVRVGVDGHPELGHVLTRADGVFDLTVNGGGALVLEFTKAGFMPVQRKAELPWNEFVVLDDVAMRGRDPVATAVNAADTAARVAAASPVTDERGRRRARVLFKPGTTARVVNAPGDTTAPLSSYTVRMTEYTVGATGEAAMPADLPATTAYTYCVELGLDEAPDKEVVFSQPVVFFVDNFLHFGVGRVAPVGSLEGADGRWRAEPDGRIVRIVSVSAGTANLDVTGDNVAETPAELAALGIDFEERRRLAGSDFAVGDTLWRAQLTHFSSVDINYAFAIAAGARGHQAGSPTPLSPRVNDCNGCPGSLIQMQNQALVESIPIVGTPWALHFNSERTLAYRATFQLRIPLSDTIPASLKRIELKVDVAGRRFETVYADPPLANRVITWDAWDGKDAYGRDVVGTAMARVRIGYVFDNLYAVSGSGLTYTGTNFGAPLRAGQVQEVSPYEGKVWTDYWVKLGNVRNAYAGLGGWSLTPHHLYDPNEPGTLYLGSGESMTGDRVSPIVVGGLTPGLNKVVDYAIAADGTEYVAAQGAGSGNARIFRRLVGGGWLEYAGQGSDGTSEGIPAADVDIALLEGLACGPDGSVYFTETNTPYRVRRITPDGRVRTIAGGAVSGNSGDDGPALLATFTHPAAVAVGSDSSVFVVDADLGVIRRVSPDGLIRRVAGTGVRGDGIGDADDAAIGTATPINPTFGRLAAMSDGGLLIADQLNGKVRHLYPNGEMRTVARLTSVASVTATEQGELYAASSTRVFEIDRYGQLVPIVGGQSGGSGGLSGPALSATATDIRALQLTPHRSLRFLHRDGTEAAQVVTVTPVLPGSRPSEVAVTARDRSEVYVFDSNGRHLRTLDGLTGGVRYRFDYQTFGSRPYLLTRITAMNGQETTVDRDPATGDPREIRAPFGRVTTLRVIPSGERPLDRVTNPDGDVVELEPDPATEKLTRMKDPRGFWHRYEYDAAGRLVGDFAPDSFATTIALESLPADSIGDRTVGATSRLGRVSRFGVDFLQGLSTERRVTKGPDGFEHIETVDGAGVATSQAADGTTTTLTPGPDPRDGMMAPSVKSFSLQRSGTTTAVGEVRSASGFTAFGSQLTVNGRLYTTGFTTVGPTRTLYLTPPMGAPRQVQVTLDSVARPLVATLPGGLAAITTAYDAAGRVDDVLVGSRPWDYRYEDGTGRLTSVQDPLTRVTAFEYDGADRLTRQTLPDQSTIQYAYDDAGNLTSLTPPGRPAHAFAYTPGNLTRMYAPPGSGADSTHYEYNADRQLTRMDRPDTQSVRLVYDAVKGRLDSLATTRGEALGFGYSAATGQLEVIQRAGADASALAFTYGGALLEGEAWSGAVSGGVSVSYDANFWPTTQTVSVGAASSAATYHYDTDGLVEDVVIGGQTYDLTPNAATGLLTSTTLGSLGTTASYNAHAELDSTRATVGGASLYAAQYGRDALGRITRWTETVQGQTTDREFEYDALGRLWQVRDGATDAQLERYAYGVNGNRDTAFVFGGPVRYATYDAQDRQLSDGSATFTYTGAGERRRRVDGAASQTTTYDALGNLRSVELSDGTTITYVVDGRNRRIGRKVNGTWTRRWLYQNALSVVAELDGSGALKKRFVYASRGHVPDVMVVKNASGPDSVYRLVTDHLGSVRLVVNASSGFVAQRLGYDAWGNVTEDTSPGYQPFGYAGGLYDPETRLVRFGARDYDARTGRWLSKDPVQFSSATTNLYAYASSAPVDNTDPRGLATDESLEHWTLARLSAPCAEPSMGTGLGANWWALPWTPNGIVRQARQEVVTAALPENYQNAWEHARGGELARAKYGWPVALTASAVKETQDYLIDRQSTTETLRDLSNTSQGILGPTRGADGRPILDGLWPSNQPNKRRAGDY